MTKKSELNPKNFRRISIINWMLLVPLLMLFSWPPYYIARFLGITGPISYAAALIFAIPFMITILHGHVTMAVGEAHRHHYYHWLSDQPFTYGLFFHPLMMRTRFRLLLLGISILLFGIGFLDGKVF